MHEDILNIYRLPDIERYQDVDLLMLSERCAAMEEKVYALAAELPENQRRIIEEYVNVRNDLDVETFKAALRLGKRHYR